MSLMIPGLTVSRCIGCGASLLKPLKHYKKHHLTICSNCKLVFSNFNPSEEELHTFYKQYSYSDDYYISPITISRYKEILQSLEPYRQHNRILDVGCGNGIFLSVAKEMGWECYGTEYSRTAVEQCQSKGLNVLHGKLEDLFNQLPQFDAIISIEVLEHINTPNTELSIFNQLLRRGGVVYITTPNFNGLLRYIVKEKYDIFAYPEHLTYYTPKTLKQIFLRNGFTPLWIQTSGISVNRFRNAVSAHAASRENPYTQDSIDESLRKSAETKWYFRLAKTMVNSILNFTGTGLTIKGLFVKNVD